MRTKLARLGLQGELDRPAPPGNVSGIEALGDRLRRIIWRRRSLAGEIRDLAGFLQLPL
jgi:hypothetical protein